MNFQEKFIPNKEKDFLIRAIEHSDFVKIFGCPYAKEVGKFLFCDINQRLNCQNCIEEILKNIVNPLKNKYVEKAKRRIVVKLLKYSGINIDNDSIEKGINYLTKENLWNDDNYICFGIPQRNKNISW